MLNPEAVQSSASLPASLTAALPTYKRINRGIPQGAVIPPTLFNFYVAGFPQIKSDKTSFADDFTIYCLAIDIAERQLSEDMILVKAWADSLELD